MLNWWLGRPTEGNRVEDETLGREPPETPAPVFAARALKSAIFGTPAPPAEDDTVYEIERAHNREAGNDNTKSQPRSLSPTKPPGILLTPGTATTRRKTVSFGNEVMDKDGERKKSGEKVVGRCDISDECPGKLPSPWVPNLDASIKPTRKTPLTRTLENAREGNIAKSESKRSSSELQRPSTSASFTSGLKETFGEVGSSRTSKSQQSNQDLLRQLVEGDNLDGEMTVDLNVPHSQSGRYWKSEYEQYHEQAQQEMKKLISYKQLAKSYAKLKDAENVDLAEKLKEYQQTVVDMEDKISQLSARVALAGLEGNDDDSPELVKELARQTALSVQYKNQVAEFRAALEGDDNQTNSRNYERKRRSSRRSEEIDVDTNRELRKAGDEQKEMDSLREEIHNLRQSLSAAEKSAQKLQEENSKLSQDLLHADLRLEKHLEKCDRKRRSFDEQRQKRDEVVQNLQHDYDRLKEHAKSQRRDAEHLLKKRCDQVVELRKEIASLRGADSNIQELQRSIQEKTIQYDQTIADYQRQIEDLKEKLKQDSRAITFSKDTRDRKYDASSTTSKPLPSIEAFHTRESQIPVSSYSISRPSKVLVPSKNNRSETPIDSPKHRSSHSALSEIINNRNSQPTPFQRSGPVQHTPLNQLTPLTNQFSNMSLESPVTQLPSAEPSLPQVTSRTIHEQTCHISPGPSMFNIASSPPRAAIVRPRVSNELSRQKSNSNINSRPHVIMASSRLSSLENSRVRGAIPPERAAAAKARLEQKQAEKRRAQSSGAGKENVPN